MKHHRLDVPLPLGEAVIVPADRAHHLVHVVRCRVGSTLVAVGDGDEPVLVEVLQSSPLTVRALRAASLGAEPTVNLTVWLPLLKGGRTDDLVRQLTELGAGRVVVYAADRSVVRLSAAKASGRLERWQRIAAEACQQCGRVVAPQVDFEAALGATAVAEPGGVYFSEVQGPTAREVLAAAAEGPIGAVLCGPEGGLTPREAQVLAAAGWRSAWLGRRVLRAETAILAAATLALHALGEGGY